MARIPYAGVQDVQQQGPAGVMEHAQASPQDFGAGVGQAEQGLGQSVQKFSDALGENAIRMEELNQTRNASIATSAYSKALGEEYANFDAMKGQAQADYYPTFIKNIENLRTQAGAGLTSPYAISQYDAQTRYMSNQYVRVGAKMAGDGQRQSWLNADEDAMTSKAAFGINMQNNPEAVVASANGIADHARHAAMIQGKDPNSAALVATGAFYHRLFESMNANGNNPGAQKLYQTVKPFMDENSIAEVDRMMEPANDRAMGDSAAQEAYSLAVPRTGQPRGLRNNNPLNLEYREGQGATSSDGRFGIYPSIEDGVAAATKQLLRYQERDGLNTVSQIVGKWAPPSENNSNAYAASVARSMGVSPDAPLDLHDGTTAAKLVSAMSAVENGRSVDPQAVQRGVLLASGVDVTRTPAMPTSDDARHPLTGDQIQASLDYLNNKPGLTPAARQYGHARLEQRLAAVNQALRADAENSINDVMTKVLQNPNSVSMSDLATNPHLTGPEKITLSNELVRLQSGKAQGDGGGFGDVVDRIQAPVGSDNRLNSTRDLVPLLGHGLTYAGLEKAQKFMKDRDAPDGPTLKAAMDTWKSQILGGAIGDPKFATPASRQRWVDFLAAVQPQIDQSRGKMPMADIVGANGPVQKLIDTGHYVLSAEEMFQSMVPGGPSGGQPAAAPVAPVVGHWYMPVGNFSGQFREVPHGTPGARRLTAPTFAPESFENPQQAAVTAPTDER